MLNFVKSSKILKVNYKQLSTLVNATKYNYQTSNVLRGCVNHDIKLCDLKIEEINEKIEMIDFDPYEKYFQSNENLKSQIESNLSENLKNSTKDNYIDLINNLNYMKTNSFLPEKIISTINIVCKKLSKIFPKHHISEIKPISLSKKLSTLKFIKSLIYNTSSNAAYIDVCVHKGDFEKAFNLMNFIRNENKVSNSINKRSLIVDSIFYEPVVRLLGKKGQVKYIIGLLNEMDEFHILPSISIIFRTFEAIGKKNYFDNSLIQRLFQYINLHNITLEDAILQAPITKENFPHIINIIQQIKPEFNIICKKPELKNKFSLKNLSINSTIDELEKNFESQLSNEQLINVTLDPIYNLKVNPEIFTKVKTIEENWRISLFEAYEKKIAFLIYSDRYKLYPYLSILPTKSYIDTMIQVVYQLSVDTQFQFNSIQNVHYHIGNIIYNIYFYRCLRKQKYFTQLKSIYLSYFDKLSENPQNTEMCKLWESSILDNIDFGNIIPDVVEWNKSIKSEVGKILYEIMFENMTFTFLVGNKPVTTPVIFEKLEEEFRYIFVGVKIQSKLTSLIKLLNKALPSFSHVDMPMLHPPVPFHKSHKSGFLYLSNYATRFIRKASNIDIFDEDLKQPHDISKVYNALNVLSMCSWRIDAANLELISKIFNENGNMELNIPAMEKNIGLSKLSPDASYRDKVNNQREYFQRIKEQKEMFSLWSTVSYKLSIAQKYKNKQFWYPYSMDFRGRIYSCSPHLNHIGDDVSRGLLRFSLGKKLGPKGLDWLKIHLINLCGTHKRKSNNDRLEAANECMSEIIDSALHPLDGKCWWQLSEKPWQTLLVCREIYNATKFAREKGNGKADDFYSTLPVHQDGSCNGLQHYAALGKDSEGAIAVNLCDSSTPKDVYSDILEHIELKRKEDAKLGVKEAILLEGLLTRKVIKQTVMTTVYGVTQYGGTLQIHGELKSLNKIPPEQIFRCSSYLCKLTLGSIGKIFTSATNIQNWFVELSANIGKLRQANISWETPMKLIVSQPYYKNKMDILKPDSLKGRNAFPPNFVHSLDSCHMMLTALRCWENNITFVSVHDCFWTHACDIDAMNKICREEFVKLHSEPILNNLSEYLTEKYAFQNNKSTKLKTVYQNFNKILKNIPQKGKFDIKEVLKSTYFFS